MEAKPGEPSNQGGLSRGSTSEPPPQGYSEEERFARERWAEYHRYPRFEEIDAMDDIAFELFVKDLLDRFAFSQLRTTPASGDQGADLVGMTPESKKVVVQAKRWQGRVGNEAIQEVLGAMLYYGAEAAIVVTSSCFSDSAKKLAAKDPRIRLVDRAELGRMIRQVFVREIPEFNWEDYNRLVRNWRVASPQAAPSASYRPGAKPHRRTRGGYRRYRPKPPPLVIHQEPASLGVWLCRLAVAALVAAALWFWSAGSEQKKWDRIGGAANAARHR
jgi:hypothetical protein